MQHQSRIQTQKRIHTNESIDKAVELSAQTTRNELKRNSMRFAAVLLAAVAIFVAVPNAALAAAPNIMIRCQASTAESRRPRSDGLFDGHAVFDAGWLNGTKRRWMVLSTHCTKIRACWMSPMRLPGQHRQATDPRRRGCGTWWVGEHSGVCRESTQRRLHSGRNRIVLVTHLHSDHVGGLTTQDGKRVFPNADVYIAKAESDFWLSPEIAAKAPKDAQPFFQSAQPSRRRTSKR